ncbi:hypothetical protein AF335_01525 [Streptomyces eurocidicus]|uniref:SPOR domain-containing protein n=1 Tax=Streptomyces eurocidicus TaxID=66423 RepID=A0A2N8P255_STREU|nr:hypothetical protein [Streptomyces eurocidicus]MBB5121075.1 hypothetical protein [Streptomyces eurocidicus]MBF6054096.1 hypothetical protein [Streptomyces eurocidicus]PNE35101.1 hypothetical protein AF335_01525 [Streptomyces eurocidicus]
MALFKRRGTGKPGEWYYCLKHGTVEEGPECRAADRLGPYDTREEAAHAMETARERETEWREDPRWNDGDGEGERGREG